MNKHSISASNKTPFVIVAHTNEILALSPSLYTRTSLTNPAYMLIDQWQGGSIAFQTTTEIRQNKYDLEVAYISESATLLTMTGPSLKCVFRLDKHGSEVAYTAMTPNARVELEGFFYDDIIACVALVIGESETLAPANMKKFEPSMRDIYYQTTTVDTQTVSATGKKSIVIPNNQYFTFTTNSNMYFFRGAHQSGMFHQMNFDTNKLIKVDRRILGALASSGGSYALTNDMQNLYPEGISTFLIEDGFLENFAMMQFNHEKNSRSVEITITAHNCRACDIRQLSSGTPNICFGI